MLLNHEMDLSRGGSIEQHTPSQSSNWSIVVADLRQAFRTRKIFWLMPVLLTLLLGGALLVFADSLVVIPPE